MYFSFRRLTSSERGIQGISAYCTSKSFCNLDASSHGECFINRTLVQTFSIPTEILVASWFTSLCQSAQSYNTDKNLRLPERAFSALSILCLFDNMCDILNFNTALHGVLMARLFCRSL